MYLLSSTSAKCLEDDLNRYVFPLAILIAEGVQFTLAPTLPRLCMLEWMSLLIMLSDLWEDMMWSHMSTRVSSNYFLWEWFFVLALKRWSTHRMEEEVFLDGSRGMGPSNTYKPRTWRWLNAKHALNKLLEKAINKDEAFCFRPYSYAPRGTTKPNCSRS